MTQRAVVDTVFDNGYARVTVERQSACGHDCSQCGGACGESSKLSVTAKNSIHAAAGDSVTIETATSGVIGAAALVYLVPIAMCLAAYFIASALGMGEDGCVAVSAAAVAAGAAAVALINRFVRRDRTLEYEIVRKERGDDVRFCTSVEGGAENKGL